MVVADNLTIDSLQRFKDDATEVREGFECGIGLGSFNDIKVDDVIETFEMREKPGLRGRVAGARLLRVLLAAAAPRALNERSGTSPPAHRSHSPSEQKEVRFLVHGTLALDLLLGDVHSLKEKRSVVRPIVAELRRRFEVCGRRGRAPRPAPPGVVGVAVVAPDRAHCGEVLDACERLVAARPEVELLSARHRCPLRARTRVTEAQATRAAASWPTASRSSSPRCSSGEVKDPRLGFVTITDARVTNDLREATVFYTVYGADEERAGTAAALESAKGVLRSEVGRQTGVRHTPSLAFVADAVPENAKHIEDLLVEAQAADAHVHSVAAGAVFAGDADPYRAPREDDDADTED